MGAIRLALSQFGAVLGDVGANLAHMRRALASAARAGAEVVCFPELSVSGYLLQPHDYTHDLVVRVEQVERELATDCRRLHVTIVYGAPRRGGDGRLRNTVVVKTPGGQELAYAKSHMPEAERRLFAPGHEFVVDDRGIGLACCYDLAFPEAIRMLALAGAGVVIVPMAWEVQRSFVMRPMVAARAIENVAYVAAINQCGTVSELRFPGRSCVVDPLGRVVAELGGEPELAVVDLDLDLVERLRDRSDDRGYPLLRDRRPELYEPLVRPGILHGAAESLTGRKSPLRPMEC
jgi:5-aminopentanamidase